MNDQALLNASTTKSRPATFPLKIQGGMLEALGINMYATIGKCLVEFVANAYDGEANTVDITIPTDRIAEARAEAKAAAKAEVKENKRDPFTILLTALPDDISIIITDNGHGMSPEDVEKKFLPINRKRRLDPASGTEANVRSENGLRHVMGRKGLGKLAGFGAATKVVIRTKRKGETFATTFTLDDGLIRLTEDIGEVTIDALYEDDLPAEQHGTTVTLTGLKADAVRFSVETISATIREAFFGIEPAELTVTINETAIEPETVQYAFVYPVGASVDALADAQVEIEDVTSLPIKYMVGFRPQGQHLHTAKRGARIYCNDRLAAGPSLFGLPTGMHNFHSQSYMECIVRADDLDRHGIDLVNTNRTQLREDNEIVKALITFVEEAMKKALAAHAKWKEDSVDEAIEKSREAKAAMSFVNTLEGPAKASARKLLRTLAVEHGVDSLQFTEIAPLLVQSVNAGDVLIRLTELGHDPKSLHVVSSNLVELAAIEKSDALKTYRGKRNGINALLTLIETGEEMWKKKGIEKQLHNLLKEQPWLIRPEYSRYLTSDDNLGRVSSALAKVIGVDEFVPVMDDLRRPDLVFTMTDTEAPHQINIVELKSPTLPLNNDHLTQLEGYMAKIENYCQMELNRQVQVHGYLIGAMPDAKTTVDSELLLINRRTKAGPETAWKVIGLRHLFEMAKDAHASVIKSLEDDMAREEAEIEGKPRPKKTSRMSPEVAAVPKSGEASFRDGGVAGSDDGAASSEAEGSDG